MATREADTALWLHNKLGSTDDLWSGRTICSQLNQEKLHSIQACFRTLQPLVKVKLLLSFLHLSRRNVEEWKVDLEEILEMACTDSDQWVTMIGEIMKAYPSTGAVNLDVDDNGGAFFTQIVSDLKKAVKKSSDTGMLPLECLFLGNKALSSVTGQVTQPEKHFTLKRKPKSAALRAELQQKSQEAASHPKKTTSFSTLPMKIRSFAKKMDDTTPLKGISTKTPGSGGFRTPQSRINSFGSTSSTLNRNPSGKKEGGIKLLDITDQPIGLKEAKRRRKQLEPEKADLTNKNNQEELSTTPDYAAGLMAPATPRPPIVIESTAGSLGPSYVPTGASRLPLPLHSSNLTNPAAPNHSIVNQNARTNLQQQIQDSIGQPQVRTQTMITDKQTINNTMQSPQTLLPPAQLTHLNSDQQQQQTKEVPKKGLSLTREQMVEAQDMFKTSNKVTRPEKALILGFMAGSRENPCPQNGPIVSIKLSEILETLPQPDGIFKAIITDTYFVMNYDTGQWKRIKKYRDPAE